VSIPLPRCGRNEWAGVPALRFETDDPACQSRQHSVVRLGVVKGEYHWHQHTTEDQFFYVAEGRLIIDLDGESGRSVELKPKQGFVVPKGGMHIIAIDRAN
jgi:mannose-6-phosphate isomerase-like protein (cupin superfamily)